MNSMGVVIGSSVPGRVAHLLPAWRKCLTMTIRPTSTIVSIGLQETNTIGYLVMHSMTCLRVLERHQLRLLAEEPLAVLRDQPAQHRGVVARKVLDMRGMAPLPAGEQPVLG